MADKTLRLCEWCPLDKPMKDIAKAVVRVPDVKEWACQRHAEQFWRGAVSAASGLRELDRLMELEPESAPVNIPYDLLSDCEKAARFDAQRENCPECGRSDVDDITTPSELGCLRCGALECPLGEQLHFDGAGCPACSIFLPVSSGNPSSAQDLLK